MGFVHQLLLCDHVLFLYRLLLLLSSVPLSLFAHQLYQRLIIINFPITITNQTIPKKHKCKPKVGRCDGLDRLTSIQDAYHGWCFALDSNISLWGYDLAHNFNMNSQKLKNKYDRFSEQIFYEDMNQQKQEERYGQFMKQENKFSQALSALHESYCPAQITARDAEIIEVQEYLKAGINSKGSSESLYISGVPGIGKTLCVKDVAKRVCAQLKAKMIYANALTVKRPIDIFKVIHYEMTKSKQIQSNNALYQLDNYFEKGHGLSGFAEKELYPKVLIIDEIDFLKTRDEQCLYSIFQWTQKKKSKLTIISISNTLDFPETLSAKVASRMGRKRIGFPAYTSQQIEKILMERLGKYDIFENQAVTYICKKIAQCSGDIRKCLFILREAIAQFLVENSSKNYTKMRIPVDTLAKTHDKIYNDSFIQNFHEFPSSYKIILYCLAKYYRNDTHPCTMRQLESLLGTFVKSRTQLLPILLDLRDLGIIKIVYNYYRSNDPNTVSTLKFQNLKEMREEHIKLSIEYDRILTALQKENLKEIKFNINLAF